MPFFSALRAHSDSNFLNMRLLAHTQHQLLDSYSGSAQLI